MSDDIRSWGDAQRAFGDVDWPFGGYGPAVGIAGAAATAARLGTGTVSVVNGVLTGSIELGQEVTEQITGSGIPFTVVERLITKQRASLSFASTNVASTQGTSLVAGPQTDVPITFTFAGLGPAYSAGLNGFLTSVEYVFSLEDWAVCRFAYEAQGGILVQAGSGGTLSGGNLFGLGTLAGVQGGIGTLLQGNVSIAASAKFAEAWAGQSLPGSGQSPLALQQRDVVQATVILRANVAYFGGVNLNGASGDITFTHVSNTFAATVQNAMLVRATTRFEGEGWALLDCEWHGNGLVVGA